jgi:hypothetical protein
MRIAQSALLTQVLVSRETGNLEASTNFGGYLVYQALTQVCFRFQRTKRYDSLTCLIPVLTERFARNMPPGATPPNPLSRRVPASVLSEPT